MITSLMRGLAGRKPATHPLTLIHLLENLEITYFTPESVIQYKRDKLEQVESELRPPRAEEIKERDFGRWEHSELRWLLMKKSAMVDWIGDEPVIRFWKTAGYERFYTYLQWVKTPLEKAVGVPEFVQAKAAEIARHLPEATFTVEELRGERRVYDPFLIVSYGAESYYVEVWEELDFERQHT